MGKIIECIPNFSEGKNQDKIEQITDAIESVPGIQLLDVDSGKAANRTVVTFVGAPDDVVEAAFRAIKKAAEVIDMRCQSGEHPRIGATDVCPLVPVEGIIMEELVIYAHKLSQRVGRELGIPVYCYEFAALADERRNLANCRLGEYEALKKRIVSDRWKPDFGPALWNDDVAKTGATAIGARNFLIAYNINLDTKSTKLAQEIASDVRESGKTVREGIGKYRRIPGSLKHTKAIGWFIKEYGITQVSMNLTDIFETPVHIVFEEVCRSAKKHGVKVTGSELVGLIPLASILDAGKYFLKKQNQNIGITDEEIIRGAIKFLGLDELHSFEPRKKIIEYRIEDQINIR